MKSLLWLIIILGLLGIAVIYSVIMLANENFSTTTTSIVTTTIIPPTTSSIITTTSTPTTTSVLSNWITIFGLPSEGKVEAWIPIDDYNTLKIDASSLNDKYTLIYDDFCVNYKPKNKYVKIMYFFYNETIFSTQRRIFEISNNYCEFGQLYLIY